MPVQTGDVLRPRPGLRGLQTLRQVSVSSCQVGARKSGGGLTQKSRVFVLFLNRRCKAGEEEVKKCTPSSNTECRKRDLSPAEPSQASPTANPSSSSDIGNSPAVSDRAATRRACVTFQYTDVFCRSLSPVLPVVAIVIVAAVLGLFALAVWWFTQHSTEIPCELPVNGIVKAVFCTSVLMPIVLW